MISAIATLSKNTNGIGDTKSPFVASTITQWFFRVLGTYICKNKKLIIYDKEVEFNE